MKKILCFLLSLLFVCCCAGAWAEAALISDEAVVCPLNLPAPPEELYTHWQLFAEEPALQLDMSAVSDPESNCFVVTLNALDAWGVSPDAMGCWVYDTETGKWVADAARILPENTAMLMVDAEYYYMNGFPGWLFASADDTFAYQLEDYSGDPNNPDYYLQFISEDATMDISLAGEGFSLGSYGEDNMSYCVYNGDAALEMGTYMVQNDDDTLVTYAMIPDEAEGGEGYVLYYINVQTADGGNWLWCEDAWEDIEGNEVPAPEGFSADELPFELMED